MITCYKCFIGLILSEHDGHIGSVKIASQTNSVQLGIDNTIHYPPRISYHCLNRYTVCLVAYSQETVQSMGHWSMNCLGVYGTTVYIMQRGSNPAFHIRRISTSHCVCIILLVDVQKSKIWEKTRYTFTMKKKTTLRREMT